MCASLAIAVPATLYAGYHMGFAHSLNKLSQLPRSLYNSCMPQWRNSTVFGPLLLAVIVCLLAFSTVPAHAEYAEGFMGYSRADSLPLPLRDALHRRSQPSDARPDDEEGGIASNARKPDFIIPAAVDGQTPVLSHIPTKQPVVFLGIDDGLYKQAFEPKLLKDYHIRASLFLDNDAIKDRPEFFQSFIANGSRIENHTLDHPLLTNLSYEQQRQQICGEANLQQQQYGQRPVLFRPPGGAYNGDTTRAAAACGMQALVLWTSKANGGFMQYQTGHSLQAGDIVLMHFRPEFKSDLDAFEAALKAAGLHTELLEDWLQINQPQLPKPQKT